MKPLAKILAAALMTGGLTVAFATPASAQDFGVSVDFGGYDYNRPCEWYRYNDFPAPRRCYDYFYGIWGHGIYLDGDFIFRDRHDWWRWHDRDDYRHWRGHDFHWHGGDHGHDRGHDGGHVNWGGNHGRGWGHDGGSGNRDGHGGDWHGDHHGDSHGGGHGDHDHDGGNDHSDHHDH